jgi:hypothetical protein
MGKGGFMLKNGYGGSRSLRLGAILTLGATAAVMCAGAASAGQVVRETIHEEGLEVLEDFCDSAGLTVEQKFVLDLRVHVVPHGPDRLAYFLQHGRRTEVITNLANDKSVTSVTKVNEKDMRVTDNGDGTLTILIHATGNAVVYGEDGKAIARNPGQFRFELVVDHGATPSDPADDEEISFRVVRDSTGRSDDFCEAVVPALS